VQSQLAEEQLIIFTLILDMEPNLELNQILSSDPDLAPLKQIISDPNWFNLNPGESFGHVEVQFWSSAIAVPQLFFKSAHRGHVEV
jgi:hypothetical protein